MQTFILCKTTCTKRIFSWIEGKFWAHSIFYAANISNIQCRSQPLNASFSLSMSLCGKSQTSAIASCSFRSAGSVNHHISIKITTMMLVESPAFSVGNQHSVVWCLYLQFWYLSALTTNAWWQRRHQVLLTMDKLTTFHLRWTSQTSVCQALTPLLIKSSRLKAKQCKIQ